MDYTYNMQNKENSDKYLNYDYNMQNKLLSRHNKTKKFNNHKSSSIFCIRYQHNYFKWDLKNKRKYINKFKHCTVWQRLNTFCAMDIILINLIFYVFCVIFTIGRIYMLCVFPFYWYFYIYLYQINKYTFCQRSNIECMENVFITALIGIYVLFLVIFVRILCTVLNCEHWFGYFNHLVIAQGNMDMSKHVRFMKVMKRNIVIFECLPSDVAMIVCSFLFSN
eukprot:487369_1